MQYTYIARNGIFIALIFFMTQYTQAQINAITETGDEVILYENGTWRYVNEDLIDNSEIPINKKKFAKDKKSTFLVKSKKFNIGIWIDPKTWSFEKGKEDEPNEFLFQKKGDDLYAMLIAEKMQIPLETLKGIAIGNARDAAPDVRLVNEEYRTVNGNKVLMLHLAGTIQGIRFTYFGYYYSNENGTIQFLAYTSEDLFETYKNDIEVFLNGLVETE